MITLQVPTLSDCLGGLPVGVVPVVILVAVVVVRMFCNSPNLDAIPTVGSDSQLGSWWAGHNLRTNGMEIIQKGYEKYKSAPFKVADRYRWIVVLGGQQHVEELRNAPDDILSFSEAANETLKIEYTLGPSVHHNPYHAETIRSQLTRSLGILYPEIRDEISVAFEEVLDLRDNEWKSVPALDVIEQIVCRTSNRLFVGLPLCAHAVLLSVLLESAQLGKTGRDSDWLDLNLRFTLDVSQGGKTISRFPHSLAPLVARFMTDVPGSTKRAMRHLGPVIEERLKCLEEYGDDWADKPSDLLSWLLHDAPKGPERTARLLTIRVLTVNFAAIHTTSNSFAHAVFLLAENPQYIQPLREEVESIVEKDGWSKASLGKMRKVDSFMRETLRFVGIGSVGMVRKALKDFTFTDGTFIPKGTLTLVPVRSLHLDDKRYDNADEFDPFRFSNMREEEGESTKHHFASTSLEYLPFGHGKHSCPGRFFAANELKSMLAHIVVSYDVKLDDGMTHYEPKYDGFNVAPDSLANVMFRKRIY